MSKLGRGFWGKLIEAHERERRMRVLCFRETKNDEDTAKNKVHEKRSEKRKTARVSVNVFD